MPPALHRELLARLAQVQNEMSAHDDADASWQQWLARCDAGCTAAEHARALARRAENDMRRGELVAAQSALTQAEAILPTAQSTPLERSKRLEVSGYLALREQRFDAAQQAFSQAIREARSVAPGGELRHDSLWLAQAEAEAGRRDTDAALRALDAARAASVDPDSEPEHVMVRSAVLASLGRYALLLDQADAQRTNCERQLRPASTICTRLRNRHLRAWVRSGQLQPVLAMWPALAPMIDSEPMHTDSMISLLMAHRAACLAGATTIAQDAAQRLDAVARHHRSAAMRARASMALAEGALSVSDLRGAALHLAQARAQAAAAASANLTAQIDLIEGLAAQAQGEPARALALMQRAQREFDRSDGPLHPLPQLLLLNQVAPLRSLGQSAQAQALLETALPILRSSLGADAPVVVRAEILAGQRMPAKPVPTAAFQPFG